MLKLFIRWPVFYSTPIKRSKHFASICLYHNKHRCSLSVGRGGRTLTPKAQLFTVRLTRFELAWTLIQPILSRSRIPVPAQPLVYFCRSKYLFEHDNLDIISLSFLRNYPTLRHWYDPTPMVLLCRSILAFSTFVPEGGFEPPCPRTRRPPNWATSCYLSMDLRSWLLIFFLTALSETPNCLPTAE